ncbi:MAG: YdbL family protein [Desulfofustis sp. PB-SRB1]|jgi:uncharacterized protein YdbL (DUF1318 family)|nr:YdbL family protein [Desulfofustis sp. PB-SRB1]MBM1003927.1 YdbL family protein [Desulfofustis sp. PB-SRB1]
MKIRTHATVVLSILFLSLFLATTLVSAAGEQERMLARVPEINALKAQGIIGENNQGFLEFRTPDPAKQSLVQAENNDRRAVYSQIAASQGGTPELVGRRRAAQIAQIGGAGHWFQRPDGSWYQK